MRVRTRVAEEQGAIAVMMIFLLVIFLGFLALSIDGGLLLSKLRQVRRANDAAALAAALSCLKSEGMDAATTQADTYAADNLENPERVSIVFEGPSGSQCDPRGGRVTVTYKSTQALMFGPAIGVSSPRPVQRSATAVWGGVGASARIAPMMLSANRLSSPGCNIPSDQLSDGQTCGFWFNNGNQSNNTPQDLQNAEWGWMNLDKWNVAPDAQCPNASANDIKDWILNGANRDLTLNPTPAQTYVCRGQGNQASQFGPNGAVTQSLGKTFAFPIDDPSRQVDSNGTLCPPNSSTNCSVDKYAIVGFAVLELWQVFDGNTTDAATYCPGHASDSNARCLVAKWHGYTTDLNQSVGGGNFGDVAVNLVGP